MFKMEIICKLTAPLLKTPTKLTFSRHLHTVSVFINTLYLHSVERKTVTHAAVK